MASPDPLAPKWMDHVLARLADGLVVIDESGHVAFWNVRAEELWHWPAVEMIGRRTDEMIARVAARTADAETASALLDAALTASETGPTVEIEILPAPDQPESARGMNRQFVAGRVFTIRDAEGTNLGTGILLRDVTRERQADAMKSQLLSTVSHELRTPLASIKGFATTLLRQDVKWDETTTRDFLRIIEEESDRLTEIIDNLLDMSQIEAGALRVDKTPTQLRTLIRDIVDEMRMRTEAHWFVVDLPAELPSVMADPRRVRQVLHNLLENAIKYSKNGQITVTCQVEGDHVVIGVADQGEGIPAEYLDQVFERFFQIDGASTRRVGGSGLGLSISRGIVQAHGGRIWIESVVGQGSTFYFTLPLAPSEAGE